MELYDTILKWGWFVFGIALATLELIAPGVFLIWLGLSAVLVGAVLLVFPMELPYAMLLFAVSSLLFALLGRQLVARAEKKQSGIHSHLNRRADALVGESFILIEPIRNGEGTIRAGDTLWRVRGADRDAGQLVRVIDSSDGKLTVE